MNILAVSAHGLYADYSSSFVHNQLKAYVKLGHRVRALVFAAAGKKTAQFGRVSAPAVTVVQDGVEIVYLRYLSLGHRGENTFNPASAEFMAGLMAKYVLKDFKPDIIHAHGILFSGPVAARLKKYCRAPYVITTHGGDTRLAAEAGYREKARKICDGAEAVGAVSELCADIVRGIGTKAPALCILNGFESSNVKKREKKSQSLVQVNALRPDKHTELSIKAVDILKERFHEIRLSVVGDGSERQMLETLVSDLGLEDYVRFYGRLPNSEALSVMAESEIFLMPSVREGFGIVYLEAMASGCVAIGTQGEGISCFIRDGENGYLAPPMQLERLAEIIGHCLENPEKAKLIAQQGEKDALALTWENNAGKYIELFEGFIPGI